MFFRSFFDEADGERARRVRPCSPRGDASLGSRRAERRARRGASPDRARDARGGAGGDLRAARLGAMATTGWRACRAFEVGRSRFRGRGRLDGDRQTVSAHATGLVTERSAAGRDAPHDPSRQGGRGRDARDRVFLGRLARRVRGPRGRARGRPARRGPHRAPALRRARERGEAGRDVRFAVPGDPGREAGRGDSARVVRVERERRLRLRRSRSREARLVRARARRPRPRRPRRRGVRHALVRRRGRRRGGGVAVRRGDGPEVRNRRRARARQRETRRPVGAAKGVRGLGLRGCAALGVFGDRHGR